MTIGSAFDIAAQVRAGTRRARDVVDECLTAIDAREADVHAFNLVLADRARSAADAIAAPCLIVSMLIGTDGRSSLAAGGRFDCLPEQLSRHPSS